MKPESVRVLTIRYGVDFDYKQLPTRKQTEAQQRSGVVKYGAVGTCDHEKQKIVIDDRLGPDYQAETLLHEVLHGLFYVVNINLKTTEEERIIRMLSPLLLDTLRNNPALLEFLLQTHEEVV